MRVGVPVLASLIIGVAAGPTASPGGAQGPDSPYGGDHDRTIAEAAVQGCAERRVDVARAGADGLLDHQFAAGLPDADGMRDQFAQVDENGDGVISREEWTCYFGPAHAGTTNGTVARHDGSD